MRWFSAILAVAAAAIFSAAPAAAGQVLPGPIPGTVERVVDGDTLAVRVQVWIGQELQVLVRLRGIDAPELRARCEDEKQLAEAARLRLASLVEGGPVVLSRVEGDKYFGRVVAAVGTAEGTDIAERLVSDGMARRYEGGRRGSWCEPQATGAAVRS